MPAINNPAGRLYGILAEARKSQDGAHIRQVWGTIFGVDPSDTPRVLSLVIQLMDLVGDTRECIEAMENIDKETYLKPIQDVEKAFSVANLDAPWSHFKGHISDSTMLGLAFCSDTLSRAAREEVVDQAALDELKADVEAMIDDILKLDIEPTLRAVILDHLESIRRAIVEYRIRGTKGLRQALDSGIGSLLRHRDELKKSDNQTLVSRLTSLFGKIDRYVALATTARKLYGHVTELLQLGG
jgi:hypothetical protein